MILDPYYRWLTAQVQHPDGTLEERHKGTPQGGVISPLLANLYLHYTFDLWMERHHPGIPFERYADDIVCHCNHQLECEQLKAILETRFGECGLQLHPEKMKTVSQAARYVNSLRQTAKQLFPSWQCGAKKGWMARAV